MTNVLVASVPSSRISSDSLQCPHNILAKNIITEITGLNSPVVLVTDKLQFSVDTHSVTIHISEIY
jgi:hypothetical protein